MAASASVGRLQRAAAPARRRIGQLRLPHCRGGASGVAISQLNPKGPKRRTAPGSAVNTRTPSSSGESRSPNRLGHHSPIIHRARSPPAASSWTLASVSRRLASQSLISLRIGRVSSGVLPTGTSSRARLGQHGVMASDRESTTVLVLLDDTGAGHRRAAAAAVGDIIAGLARPEAVASRVVR